MADDDDVVLQMDFTKLQQNVDLAVLEGLNQAGLEFRGELAKQLPHNPIEKIVVKPSNKEGDMYTVSVAIEDQGMLKWIWAYWKGLPSTITITAHKIWMKFDDWDKGDDSYRWKTDGLFHFHQVHHTYPPHPFVENAIANFQQTADIISRRLVDRLK